MEDNLENEAPGKPLCLNCDKKMPRKATFCPNCGQRNNQGKVSMKELLRRFWSNFSHLDGKFVKMCWQLLVPGKVSREYFAGRQKRYPHPVQFFFVVMFFFLLMFSKVIGDSRNGSLNLSGKAKAVVSTESKEETDVEIKDISFYEVLQRYVWGQHVRSAYDSLPGNLRTPPVRLAIDSAVSVVNRQWDRRISTIRSMQDSTDDQSRPLDSIPLNLFSQKINIAVRDLVELSPAQILDRYHFTDWKTRILITQSIKSLTDPRSLIRSYTGSIGWTILILITLMSTLLYLMYFRQKRYYAEHFVFLMHQNSGAFLLLTIFLALEKLAHIDIHPVLWVSLFLWITVALLLAMKRFYGQGWPKTVLKWFIYCFLYGIAFSLIFLISLLTVFLIF